METNALLITTLEKGLKKIDGNATYPSTYSQIPKGGLFTDQVGNKQSKSWPKAEYMVTTTRDQGHSYEDCLYRWREISADFRNQYLIIGDDQIGETNTWRMFDSEGNLMLEGRELIDFFKHKFGKKALVSPGDIDVSYKPYLRAMRAKPFLLLAGISGTGKSRIVKQMAFDCCKNLGDLQYDRTTPGNYCLIEVKPNWHDSTELLGYESHIGKPHYVLTPFVRFLVKAMLYESARVPFFVCLDEMNLAPVEQYFAEFLSVVESRMSVDGKITTEALISSHVFSSPDYGDRLEREVFGIGIEEGRELSEGERQVYDTLRERGLRIPSNLVVVGTVNMDDTTHQFSRKVIDRAMTIEMDIADGPEPFIEFFNADSVLGYREVPLDADRFLPTVVSASEYVSLERVSEETVDFIKREVPERLNEINTALAGTPFRIAYRVENELILYFDSLMYDLPGANLGNLMDMAIDDILMMKVLPRVEGDEDTLREPLDLLEKLASDRHYTKSLKKVQEMSGRMNRGSFTSFWP